MQDIEIEKRNDVPTITVKEDVARSGTAVADVEVQHADGTFSKFFISVGIKKSRAVCEVSVNNNTGGSVSKSVTGFKRNKTHEKV